MQTRWAVQLSDGRVIKEGEGDWILKPKERTPWVRLVQLAEREGLYFADAWLELIGNFQVLQTLKFSDDPLYFSYHHRAEIDLDTQQARTAVNLVGHFDGYEIHLISPQWTQNIFIKRTEGFEALCPSPLKPSASDV